VGEADASYLIVGNSYAGAIIGALEREGPGGWLDRIDVAAAGGGNFRLIGVEAGRVARARLFRQRDRPVAAYRAIFVYGYLPHPIQLAMLRRRLVKRFSAQVTAVALHDAVSEADSLLLRARLRAATAAPVFVLPGNPAVNTSETLAAERDEMSALLRDIVGEGYLSPPDGLLDGGGRPNARFYKDSVTIEGRFTADPKQSKHDLMHLNIDGGALWLAAMTDKMRELDDEVNGHG